MWNHPEEALAETANRILAALAAEMEFPPEELVLEDGYTCLAVNQASVLHLRLAEEALALDVFMELGALPFGPERLRLCEDMLQGNVLFQGTGGAALGMDRERGIAVLSLRVPLPGLEAKVFRDGLERFLAAAEFWKDRLAGMTMGGETGGETSGEITFQQNALRV
ncbi:MAG: type III secretion system chaperone [Candidatus Accumulibacter sp.]|nr:type III secretion system chaperone [Accumulibacter sp.]